MNAVSPQASVAARAAASDSSKRLGGHGEMAKALLLIFSALGLYFSGDYWYDDSLYKPEEGLGYWLGVVGGVMMLLAYIYSMRKHLRSMRLSGLLSRWLRIHIIFGIVGPYLIIFHTGFQLESQNAKYAFYSMIAVFLSGVVGRYLYSRVHFGLDGKRAGLRELHRMLGLESKEQQSVFAVIPGVKEELARLDAMAMEKNHGVAKAFTNSWAIRLGTISANHRITRRLRKHLMPIAEQQQWNQGDLSIAEKQIRIMLREYFTAVNTVARFRVYDQLFMLWRMVHVPLLFLLFIAGVFHVVYVHMFSTSGI